MLLPSIREPTIDRLKYFLSAEQARDFTYHDVGATAGENWPAGFDHDFHRVLLGHGEQVFQAACQGLREWRQFPAPWTRIFPADAPLVAGTNVAVQFHVGGLWWLSSARIVFTIDEPAPIRRFGFAYGTLPGHIECGEERFSIELHDDESVWYDLRAFSRPRFWPMRLGYPIARRYQRRFARNSQVSMQTLAQASG
ncbi:MAG TPA: DUF1990 domain-containing protein [Pirellulales bacterium]|jgi:uncharacterized protein (UPF0548 family)